MRTTLPPLPATALTLILWLPGHAAALSVFTSADAVVGPVTVAGSQDFDRGAKPDSSANASYTRLPFSSAAGASAFVDPDGPSLGVEFFINGSFDPAVQLARTNAAAVYQTDLTLAAGPGGLPGGTGSIRFRFDIDGSMGIDGNPVPGSNNFAGRPSQIIHFNQLHVSVDGERTLVFRTEQSAPGTLGFNSFYVSDPLPLDLQNPGELSVEWMGGAAIDFMGGSFKVESLFGSTATLTGVEVRNAAGAVLDVRVLDDLGRPFGAAPVPGPASGLMLLAGLAGIAAARWRRPS